MRTSPLRQRTFIALPPPRQRRETRVTRIIMVLLTHNTELNLSTGTSVHEHGVLCLKAFGFGADLRHSAESLAGANEPHLPVDGIARKWMRKTVQTSVS